MSVAQENLERARKAYDIATTAWYRARDMGDLRKFDLSVKEEAEEYAKGCRWKPDSPRGHVVLGTWQRAKAELDAAAAAVQREAGDTTCPECGDNVKRTAPPWLPARQQTDIRQLVGDLAERMSE